MEFVMLHYRGSRFGFVTLLCLALLPGLVDAGVLTDLLIAKLGVSQPQADGGAGSIFKLARGQMTPENFQKLRTVVPGLDNYIGAAPAFLPNERPVAGALPAAGQTAALAGLAGGRSAKGAALTGLAGGSSAKGAAITGLAGGSSAQGAAVAGLAGGSSAKGAALAGLAGGGSGTGALAGMAGGGSATGALAAAAMGQTPSPGDALKGAARNQLSQSLGGAIPGSQGGMAGIAAGAMGANAGGSPLANAAGALLAGTAIGDKLQAAQALAPAFQQLGMDQGMVARFLPLVIDYVKSVGGKSSSKLLTHALGF
jgi:hypothetical protein